MQPSTATAPATSTVHDRHLARRQIHAGDRMNIADVRDRHRELLDGDGLHELAGLCRSLPHATEVGEKDLVERQQLTDRTETGEFGGFQRTAELAGNQAHMRDAVRAERLTDTAGLRAAGIVKTALDRAILNDAIGLRCRSRRIGVAQQHNMARLHSFGIVRPCLRQINRPVDEGMAVTRHIGREHADLAIGDLASRARILARNAA